MAWTFTRIADHDGLTEGPAWDGTGLLYSECPASLTWRWDPANRSSTVWRKKTGNANGMVFDERGRLFACEGGGRRIVRYAADQPTVVVADRFEDARFNEPNDLAIDRSGRIWFSDPNYGARPMELIHESVYRVDGGTAASQPVAAQRVTFDTTRPNGVLLAADESELYVAESPYGAGTRRQLRAYPIGDDGSLGGRRLLHDFGDGRGVDGMCLTADGNILATAGFRQAGPGPMLYLFEPSGRVLETHPTPADRPTNCTFGGDGLDELFVTFAGGEVYQIADSGLTGLLAWPS